ncbi:MAG: zinc ribbon domain-containing protein [Oscillospiraceae bacterium]|jgi:hypothetical protein|nr:zinc ribbon domain-containing protein [Oscillospiraceae bacterium]
MYCKKCGAKNKFGDQVCGDCGERLSKFSVFPPKTTPDPAQAPQNHATPTAQINKNGCGCLLALLPIIALVLVLVIPLVIWKNSSATIAETQAEIIRAYTTTKTEGPLEASTEDSAGASKLISAATGADETQAAVILQILNNCGVMPKSIAADSGENDYVQAGSLGFRISTDIADNIILSLANDKTVLGIQYAETFLYENGTMLKQLKEILTPPDLELIGEITTRSSYSSTYIKGKVRNNTDQAYSYVTITFGVYDEEGNRLDTASSIIQNLGAGEVWSFEALTMADNISDYKLIELSGTQF